MNTSLKYFSLLSLALILSSCRNISAKKSDEEGKEKQNTFEFSEVQKDTLSYNLQLSGELKPYEKVTLFAKVKGFVTDIRVNRGDEVKKGQVLMKIEAPEVQEKLLAAQAKKQEALERLRYSHQNYNRMKRASTTEGAVSATELEQIKAQFRADSAALRGAKAEVSQVAQLAKYTEITAPFDGVVSRRMVSPGALVGKNKKSLLQLSREDKMRLEVSVPSKHRQALQIGTKAEFSVNSYPGKTFSVQLSRSSKALNADKRRLMVEFDYDNKDDQLSSGDYAQVNLFLTRHHPTLNVPSSSLISSKTDIAIAKVVNGKIELTPVTTGLTHGNSVEVYGDITSGDRVIKNGNSTLKTGMAVAVKQD